MRVLSVMVVDRATVGMPTEGEIAAMGPLLHDLKRRGVLVETGGAMPGALELTVTRAGGKTTVTDGPFTEAKEFVGGYALLDVADREEAIAVTQQFLEIAGDARCMLHEVSVAI